MAGVSHWLNVRDRPGFLRRMMELLAGDARMSLEGELERCRFDDQIVLGRQNLGVLKTCTIAPPHDFVILHLNAQTIESIFKQILAAGLKRAIWHIQIEREGVMELGAYDNFHADCVVTGPGISTSVLEALKREQIIWNFCVAKADVLNAEVTTELICHPCVWVVIRG